MTTKKQVRAVAETKLEKAVAKWVTGRTEPGYTVEQVFKDLFHGGCSSGIVGHLIYYDDTVAFYRKHEEDIWNLACDEADAQGENVFAFLARCGHDTPSDPDTVMNFLAWFGFEEAARRLAARLGLD